MAARAGIPVQSMGELVDDLEAKGYLERRPDPKDRRAKCIHLTGRGRKNARIAKQATADVEDHLAGLLGQQQQFHADRGARLRRDPSGRAQRRLLGAGTQPAGRGGRPMIAHRITHRAGRMLLRDRAVGARAHGLRE